MHVDVVSSTYWPPRGLWVGILGWVSDRDAQHRPLTHIATKGQKGIETIHFAKFWQKGVEIWHFPRFCSSIGVETKQTFHRPEKWGQNGRTYLVFIKWVPSPGPDHLFDSMLLSKTIPHDPRKATKLTIITCSAIWYEAQQQCCRLTCNIWKRTYVFFCTWLCIHD